MVTRASPGEARPYQRRLDGLWVVVVRDVEGRRKYLYSTTKPGVLERRHEYLAGSAAGLSLPSTKLTVGH